MLPPLTALAPSSTPLARAARALARSRRTCYRARRTVVWLVTSALLAFACDTTTITTSDPNECEPETVDACEPDGDDCYGMRECVDGAWSACRCVESSIGAPCDSDRDCVAGEVCFVGEGARFLGGAAVTGFCTVRCDESPQVCERREPAAVCIVTHIGDENDTSDDEAHCFERCEVGGAPGDKCQEDEHLACAALAGGDSEQFRKPTRTTEDELAGVCRPLCTQDEQCDSGGCNLLTGACAEAQLGDPLGTPCDPEAEAPTCAGICVGVDGVGFCSHRCRLGSADDCGQEESGLCFFPEEEEGSIGDAGFCSLLCDSDDECEHEEMHCEPFGAATLEALTGKQGVCSPGASSLPELGDRDAGGMAGGVDAGEVGSGVDGGAVVSNVDAGSAEGGADGGTGGQ